jgi:hypothetical protein
MNKYKLNKYKTVQCAHECVVGGIIDTTINRLIDFYLEKGRLVFFLAYIHYKFYSKKSFYHVYITTIMVLR